MIISRLQGGLGNQLFQYAAARAVSVKKNDDNILFDCLYYLYVRNRGFKLFKFDVVGHIGTVFDSPLYFPSSFPPIRTAYANFYATLFPNKLRRIQEGKLFQFDQRICRESFSEEIIDVDGYWQNWRYADSIREILLKEISPRFELSKIANRYLSLIEKSNSVLVHVRRGDYVKSKSFNICTPEYYLKSVKFIQSKIKSPQFFIFSDELSYAKELFSGLSSVSFVENCADEAEELVLMRLCKNAIIANSTFSWWGAWLNFYQRKIVVAPDPWTKGSSISDIIPREWVLQRV